MLFTIIESYNEAHFNFGGFYHTIHDAVIDSNVEAMNTIEINDCGIDVDYNSSQRNYCDALLESIDTKFKTNFKDCFVRIWSPDYYNYNNDSILIDLTKLNNAAKNLVYNVKKQKKLENYLNDFNNLLELEFEVDYKVIN